MKNYWIKLLTLFFIFASIKLNAQTVFIGEEIKEKLISELRELVGKDAEIILPKIVSNFSFPQNNVTVTFDFGNQILSGNIFVGIEFWHNENKLRRVEIPVRIKLVKEVLVAKKMISRGETISDENTLVERKELPSSINPEDIKSELILGKIAKYSIVKGTILSKDLVQEPLAIRRGEKVRVVVLSGKVQINTYGVALNDANAGEQVRVRREGNGGIIIGLASSDGCVIVSK